MAFIPSTKDQWVFCLGVYKNIILGQYQRLEEETVIRISDRLNARLRFDNTKTYPKEITDNCVIAFSNIYEDVDGIVRHYYYEQSSRKQGNSLAL